MFPFASFLHTIAMPGTAHYCGGCNRHFVNRQALEQHLSSSIHNREKEDRTAPSSSDPNKFLGFTAEEFAKVLLALGGYKNHTKRYCFTCSREFVDAQALEEHLKSSSAHRSREPSARTAVTPSPNVSQSSRSVTQGSNSNKSGGSNYCTSCARSFVNQHALQQHLGSSIHNTVGSGSQQHTTAPSQATERRQLQEKKEKKYTRPADALDEFFAQYPEYPYDRNAPFRQEFFDLLDWYDWPRKSWERDEAWKAFRIASVKAFGTEFGRDENDPEAWRRLCETAGINPIPRSMEDRRETIMSTHINLVDMHEQRRMGLKARTFATLEELRAYTKETGRRYPLDEAYADGLLRYLLREIDRDYLGHRRPKNWRG